MSVFADLEARGLVYQGSEGVAEHLAGGPVTLYIGFDPSAASLHVGSLLPILALARMQRHGHSPIALVGGGTGLIGDPSGKSQERALLTREQVEENAAGIRDQLSRFLDFDHPRHAARLINNAEWLTTVSLIGFLRDVGKHFSVNTMLAKDSVKIRLEGEGITFTEFSYQLLQSWDYVVLNERYGCTLQMGGSDQWGNITAGTDLIRRMGGSKSYGLVMPLVTNSSGVKFGKTESGAVWLDAALTSPYRFYQFWLNTGDADVVRYLRYFTFLDQARIAELEAALLAAPQERAAQTCLAREVTTMVHDATATGRAERCSEVLFGGALSDLGADDILEVFDQAPSSQVDPSALDGDGMLLTALLESSGVTPSKGAARRLVRDGGAYLNNRRIRDQKAVVRRDDFLDGRVLVLRKGQKSYHLITLGTA